MTAHTPGPWTANPEEGDYASITTDDGREVAGAYSWANGRLIAAAPDLLAALEELVTRRERVARKQGGSLDGTDGRYVRARAAIARAKGEKP